MVVISFLFFCTRWSHCTGCGTIEHFTEYLQAYNSLAWLCCVLSHSNEECLQDWSTAVMLTRTWTASMATMAIRWCFASMMQPQMSLSGMGWVYCMPVVEDHAFNGCIVLRTHDGSVPEWVCSSNRFWESHAALMLFGYIQDCDSRRLVTDRSRQSVLTVWLGQFVSGCRTWSLCTRIL